LLTNQPKICVALVSDDLSVLDAVTPLADMFEVRIDLIGSGWRKVVKQLKKPWIACVRKMQEGGKWRGTDTQKIKILNEAVELGASIVDIELNTPKLAGLIRKTRKHAQVLVSYHNLKETPPLKELKAIVVKQKAVGADICKVVTTARTFTDNVTVLQLIPQFSPTTNIIAFAMGSGGQFSRILCPLAGGVFTYASVAEGKKSADGQLSVKELRGIYGTLIHD
jgi:3-dehydroquinate dehydratase-1